MEGRDRVVECTNIQKRRDSGFQILTFGEILQIQSTIVTFSVQKVFVLKMFLMKIIVQITFMLCFYVSSLLFLSIIAVIAINTSTPISSLPSNFVSVTLQFHRLVSFFSPFVISLVILITSNYCHYFKNHLNYLQDFYKSQSRLT